MTSTFVYVCLGALLVELFQARRLRSRLLFNEAPDPTPKKLLIISAITVLWILGTGLVSIALEMELSTASSFYFGASFPSLFQNAFRSETQSIELDSIEPDYQLTAGDHLRSAVRLMFT